MRIKTWLAASIFIPALSGCAVEEEPSTATWGAEVPSFEEWLEQWPVRDDGAVIVEGDMPVHDEEDLRALYEHRYPGGQEGQALTLDVTFWGNWNDWDAPTRYNLTYCVSDAFGTLKPAVVDAMKYAAAGWESAADVDFRYLPQHDASCTTGNNNVLFNVEPRQLDHLGDAANAFRPDHDRGERHLDIDPDGSFSTGGRAYRRYLMRHELGHVLGFLHEFYNDSLQGPNGCSGDDNGQVVSGPDPNSVMMYYSCPTQPIGFYTDRDMMGAAYVYGPPQGYDVLPADYDGDGYTDLAVRYGRGGNWCIKYNTDTSDNDWSLCVDGYGSSGGPYASQPAVGDYDGDLKADLSVKEDHTGIWFIDGSLNNGFNGWDQQHGSRGGSSAKVTPADYDGDNKTDLSVKDSSGNWHIDYSSDGFGPWNLVRGGYGNADSVPVPGKYNADPYADLAVRENTGLKRWRIDYASFQHVWHPDNGYLGFTTNRNNYGGADTVPVPYDYDGDNVLDLAIKSNDGKWYIDYWAIGGGYWGWNEITPSRYGDATWVPMPGRWSQLQNAQTRVGDLASKRINNAVVVMQWGIDWRSSGYGNFPFDEYHSVLQ